jgi:uncharacterized protein (DUF2267 family)
MSTTAPPAQLDQLTEAVTSAFTRVIASGAIEQAIEKNLSETISGLIREQLKSYSPFAKLLQEQVSKAMQVDFTRLDLPTYGDMILKIIRAKVDAEAGSQFAKNLEAQLSELLVAAPEEVSLTALVDQFKEHYADRYAGGNQHEKITLIVGDNDYGSQWIYMDAVPDKDKYGCAVRFLVSNQDGKISALRLDQKEVEKTIFVGPLYGFERSLFQMHTAGTKLTGLDADIDTYYPGRD